jgi:hypothetical protein
LSDYEHARNLLTLLISNHPSNYLQVADAHVTIAHIEYRCLRDYRAAQEHLSEVLNDGSLATELGSGDLEVKVLLAKCRQKLGEYDIARRLWEEIRFSNAELDTEGRFEWITNSANWSRLDDSRVTLYIESGVSRDVYLACLSSTRDSLAMVESVWGMVPGGNIEVFLYASTDSLFDYTLRSNGFTIPGDAEIHMVPRDIEEIEYLVGWLVSQRLNTRPEGTIFPLFRAGFSHYYLGSRDEVDALAARELYYYGGTIEDNILLFPLSFDYTYSEEYTAMCASFLHYLIEEGRVSVASLAKFYRLLWANPAARWQAPLISELIRLNPNLGATSWQQGLITPAQVSDLSINVLGLDLEDEIQAWQGTLTDEIAFVTVELGSLTADVQRVQVDLTTPENALRSWWEAYRAGDFDALISASTREMGSFFSEARDIYREQGILDQVILDHFIRPYRSANMVVVQTGTFAEDLYVFEVKIEKGDEIEEMTIVIRYEDGKWKVDSN